MQFVALGGVATLGKGELVGLVEAVVGMEGEGGELIFGAEFRENAVYEALHPGVQAGRGELKHCQKAECSFEAHCLVCCYVYCLI